MPKTHAGKLQFCPGEPGLFPRGEFVYVDDVLVHIVHPPDRGHRQVDGVTVVIRNGHIVDLPAGHGFEGPAGGVQAEPK